MLKVEFRTGKGGRVRWFVVDPDDTIQFSCFPRSFRTERDAWRHAERMLGVGISMVNTDPDEGFEQFAGERDFN